jgi:hypothetical protein
VGNELQKVRHSRTENPVPHGRPITAMKQHDSLNVEKRLLCLFYLNIEINVLTNKECLG